jgi:hypothetical protein
MQPCKWTMGQRQQCRTQPCLQPRPQQRSSQAGCMNGRRRLLVCQQHTGGQTPHTRPRLVPFPQATRQQLLHGVQAGQQAHGEGAHEEAAPVAARPELCRLLPATWTCHAAETAHAGERVLLVFSQTDNIARGANKTDRCYTGMCCGFR